MGPFAGSMVNTMVPELMARFRISEAAATTTITWYLVPFAVLMVVSGTVAHRWGLVRSVRVAYLAFAAGSVLAALAPTFGLLAAGRAVQGVANAFTTPLLISLIAARAGERRGRALGIYASAQAAGQAFAPFFGGVAAQVDYRLAFVITAVAALGLWAFTRPDDAAATPATGGIRGLVRSPVLQRASLAAFGGQLAITACMVLAGLLATDRFGASGAWRGAVVALFGAGGIALGPALGRLSDRIGMRRVGVLTLVTVTAAAAATGLVPHLVVLGVVMFLGGAAWSGMRVFVTFEALSSSPGNTSGATSLMLATQFLGGAIAPALLSLRGHSDAAVALAAAAIVVACGVPALTVRGAGLDQRPSG